MPTPQPTLAQLHRLKRAELQAYCKENEIKANGKTADLIQALAKHWNLSDSLPTAPAPKSKKAPSHSNNNKPTEILPPVDTGRISTTEDDDDEEDEMMMQPAQSAVVLNKKKSMAVLGLGAGGAGKKRVVSGESSGSTSIVHTTSPGTKSTIAQLLSTVSSLQTSLTATRAELSTAQSTLSSFISESTSSIPPDTPRSTKMKLQEEIRGLVRTEMEGLKQGLLRRFDEGEKEVEGLREEVEGGLRGLEEKMEGVMERVMGLEKAGERLERVEEPELEEEERVEEPALEEEEPVVEEEEPLAEGEKLVAEEQDQSTISDAPPIQSLATFSSPLPSATHSPLLTATHSPLPQRISTPSSRRSPRRSALPAHIYHTSPASPALPTQASLGKRRRGRDSEMSFDGAVAVRSPPLGGGMLTFGVLGEDEGVGHKRKRIRVGETAEDEGEDNDSIIDHEPQPQPEVEVEEPSFATSTADDQEPSFTSTEADDSIRDYLVQTKPATPTPTPSTSDPSFFAAGSRSAQSTRTLPLTPGTGPAAAGRKSLPISALPFPIISPFKVATNTAPSAPAFSLNALPLPKSPYVSKSPARMPVTPKASATLYGTEDASERFGDDEIFGDGEGSPRKLWGRY